MLIPPRVVSRRDLPANAKLLLAVIAGLCDPQGCCRATNAFLAARLGVESRYVSSLLAVLEGKGLLRSLVLPEKGNECRLYVHPDSAAGVGGAAQVCVTSHAQTDR